MFTSDMEIWKQSHFEVNKKKNATVVIWAPGSHGVSHHYMLTKYGWESGFDGTANLVKQTKTLPEGGAQINRIVW